MPPTQGRAEVGNIAHEVVDAGQGAGGLQRQATGGGGGGHFWHLVVITAVCSMTQQGTENRSQARRSTTQSNTQMTRHLHTIVFCRWAPLTMIETAGGQALQSAASGGSEGGGRGSIICTAMCKNPRRCQQTLPSSRKLQLAHRSRLQPQSLAPQIIV